jgi:hypothetical protein
LDQQNRGRGGEGRGGEGEGLEHSRLADTHGIRARWESESEQMGGRGRIRHGAHGWERHDGTIEPLVPSTVDLPLFPGSLRGGKGRNQTMLGMKVEELNIPRRRRRLAAGFCCQSQGNREAALLLL